MSALGETTRFTAEVRDQYGQVMAGAAVGWASSDVSVAPVDASGLVTATANGRATITASAGQASGTAAVTVAQVVSALMVSPAEATIAPGDTLRLEAEAFDENGHRVSGAALAWSSSDVGIASVDSTGLVQAIAEGMTRARATAGNAVGVAEITVENLDRAALVALYDATDGPNWVNNENWLTDAPLGDWHGVDTDAYGRVTGLDLGGQWDQEAREWIPHGLSGPIPPTIASLTSLRRLDFYANSLTGSIPSELGDLKNLEYLSFGDNQLSGPIPSELGDLVDLSHLSLFGNDLSGNIPPRLGNLGQLRELYLNWNALTGTIPQTFLRLDRLHRFYVGGNEELCVPGSSAFVAWLRAIERRDQDPDTLFCNAADVAVLKSLYELASGSAWTESAGWLVDGGVEEWHGVSADSLGKVTELDLTGNGLAGRLPLNLGDMKLMTELRIGGNAELSGRLPLSLTRLSLRVLHYSETGLCAPGDTSFQAWLNTIGSHVGTGECGPLTDREILEVFHHSTGGPDWTNSQNWLTDAPLGEWHGVGVNGQQEVSRLEMIENNLKGTIPPELGDLSSLVYLQIRGNSELTGSIPPELGDLSNLAYLDLFLNSLTGTIPPALGDLAELEALWLGNNALTGPIPAELGNLAHLNDLVLQSNSLTGAIPPELGNLSRLTQMWAAYAGDLSGDIPPELGALESLEVLSLSGNNLDGPIPPTLGELANLERLFLDDNNLDGPIPPALGELANVRIMWLHDNEISGQMPGALGSLTTLEELLLANNNLRGPVPAELGGMSSLKQLALTNNTGMAGPLPSGITGLRQLEGLLAEGTDLCVPPDPDVQTWIARVHKRRIKPCIERTPTLAYLTQAVQSREFPVPLVAGERALLRVFPTARKATTAGIPAMRARFFVAGRETHVEYIPGKSAPIPTELDESSLSQSANAEIPGEVIQPGLEMVIEVDPEGTLDDDLGITRRIPATGQLAVDVRAMPLFDLTLIPFIWSETQDSSIVSLVDAVAADPENHEMLEETRILLPVGALDVTAHEPVLSSSNNAFDLRRNAQAIRAMEGRGTGHYMGMMARPVTGAAGIAYIGDRVSFAIPFPIVIAHELGHNMSLFHAPCGGAGGPDPSYPYADGSTGAWGYDLRDGGRLVHPSEGRDLMSYCNPRWISDFSFTNALRYRLFDEGAHAGRAVAASTARSLLLWGGIRTDSVPYLEPTFVLEAPSALPESTGAHRIAGHARDGSRLFSFTFAMPQDADGDGSSSFAFVLPVRSAWEGNLASITLTGPGGSATLDADSNEPMVILRNPRNGQVRAILRDPASATRSGAEVVGQAAGPGLEMLFSRGIPGAAAWRR